MLQLGSNPYRTKPSLLKLGIKVLQFLIGSAQLRVLNASSFYRNHLRKQIKRPVDIMVIGAQKSGTTWVHAEMQRLSLAAVSPLKECHHFDRGRMWTIHNYLTQYDGLPEGVPVVEVAPDYGPMARWRVQAIRALFPDLNIVFLARNPVERAWSGTRMETGFDRGLSIKKVPVADLVAHLRLIRSRRYSDYVGQITTWSDEFGAENVTVFPYETLTSAPETLLQEIVALAEVRPQIERQVSSHLFKGETGTMPDAVCHVLRRDYKKNIDALAEVVEQRSDTLPWKSVLDNWRDVASRLSPPPEKERCICYVCGFQPNPNATSSGQKLAYRKIVELAERFNSVRLMYFVNEFDALDSVDFKWPHNVVVLPPLRLKKSHRLAGMLRFPLSPSFASTRRFAARKVIQTLLKDPAVTDFYADFSQGVAAFPDASMALCTLRQHDVVSKLYQRQSDRASGLRALAYSFEAARARHWESRVWNAVMRLTTLTEEDARNIRACCPEAEISAEVVRGTIDTDSADRNLSTIVPGRIGFWGNMARFENVDAVAHMVTNLLPRIQKYCPEAHFWIIGAHPTAKVESLSSDVVHVTGYVKDPSKMFATLDVAVAPLRLGSGVKIKVFETIDMGIPTVVSPVGGEGIEDHASLVRTTTDEEFVVAVIARLRESRENKGSDTTI